MIHQNKVAIVTGASLGIGRAVAHKLGSQGAALGICARNSEQLEKTARWLGDAGIEILASPCDVRNPEQVNQFVGEVERRFGPIGILINNAGMGGPNPMQEASHSAWRRIISVNLDGTYYFCKRVLARMPSAGRIVNLSSVLGKFGVPGYTAYCAAKHGVIGLTRALSLEVAARKITVNAICPGWVETQMAEQGMRAGAQATGTTYEEFRSSALADVPLAEILDPEEIADLISFLASGSARNITGQAYNICGGQIMH